MRPPEYYATLGVPLGATAEQIERAYKLLARMSHPDAFPNDPRGQAWANERMKQINEAYAVLSDPVRRPDYDQTHGDVHRANQTSAAESFLRCPACEGGGETVCLTCGGSGNEDCPGCQGRQSVTCPACAGAGSLSSDEYERLVHEILHAETQSQTARARYAPRRRPQQTTEDPFWQPGYWDRPQTKPELRPAPLLSLFIPGAGQLYNGEPQKALTYFGIAFFLFIGVGLLKGFGLLLLLIFWIYNVYDANAAAGLKKQ